MEISDGHLHDESDTSAPPVIASASYHERLSVQSGGVWPRPDGELLHLGGSAHRADLDHRHFAFDHDLARLPLFDLDRLLVLARNISQTHPKDIYYDAGHVDAGTRWNDMPKCDFSVADALHRIEHASAWIILRRVHLDPDFAPMLDRCMQDITHAGGKPLADRITEREAIVIITSPQRVTAFHMDRECGFLMQVRGAKEISLFDPTDRDVLPEREIELFWTSDNNAPVYRPQFQDRGTTYPLVPGRGVHIPVNAPHWIRNSDEISISVNINFLPSENERGHIYRTNHLLRKFGMNPTPPFRSPVLDAIKRPIGAMSMHGRELIRVTRSALHPKHEAAS